jgi:polar amino acid transport system substrate-binding protein
MAKGGCFMFDVKVNKLRIAVVPLIITLILQLSGLTFSNSNKLNKNINTGAKEILIVSGEFPPLVSENLPGYGMISNIVTAIMKDTKLPFKIKFYPWARCEEMVRSGEAFAAFPYALNAQRQKEFYFSNPIFTSNDKFFYLNNNKKITKDFFNNTKLSDFKSYIFGGQLGYWYGSKDDVDKLGIQSEWTTSTESLIKMLYNRRIDFFIDQNDVSRFYINKLYPNQSSLFGSLKANAKVQFSYLMASRKYSDAKEIINKVNISLNKLQTSGVLDKILKNYTK